MTGHCQGHSYIPSSYAVIESGEDMRFANGREGVPGGRSLKKSHKSFPSTSGGVSKVLKGISSGGPARTVHSAYLQGVPPGRCIVHILRGSRQDGA